MSWPGSRCWSRSAAPARWPKSSPWSRRCPAPGRSRMRSSPGIAPSPTTRPLVWRGNSSTLSPSAAALRHLSAAYARRGDADGALGVADADPAALQRISARLFLALRLARGTPDQRARARVLVESTEDEVRRTLARRRDRSPRLAICSAIWRSWARPAGGPGPVRSAAWPIGFGPTRSCWAISPCRPVLRSAHCPRSVPRSPSSLGPLAPPARPGPSSTNRPWRCRTRRLI